MNHQAILELINQILQKQGKPVLSDDNASLQEIGFRSLDFSELALRVEMASGQSLTFDAGPLRAIRTVKDVIEFLERASNASNPAI